MTKSLEIDKWYAFGISHLIRASILGRLARVDSSDWSSRLKREGIRIADVLAALSWQNGK